MSHDELPTPDMQGAGPGDNSQSRTGTGRKRSKRRRWILGGSGVACVMAAGLTAASLLGPGPHVGASDNPSASSTEPAAPSSAAPKPSSFAPFSRPEYSQLGAGPGATAPVEETTINVSGEAAGTSLPDGLVGLSLETDSMTDPNLDPENSTLAAVLKKSTKPVIRFGGQAVDRRFFWTSSNEPLPDWKLVPAYKGDVRPIVKVQPADLQRIKRLLDASDGRILLSADMGHFDPARAADFAAHAIEILGDRLVGISLGNEPNGYNRTTSPYWTLRDNSWDFDAWSREAKANAEAIAKSAPDVQVVGPEVYSNEWWKRFAKLGLPNVGAMAYHHYPLPDCPDASDPLSPSIARVMSRELADSSKKYHEAAAEAARSAKIPAWLTETGISSCGGSNETTKRHVSALWTVNYAMSAAQAGVSQVDLHSSLDACKGGPPLSPICDSGPYQKPNGIVAMRSAYYGMMLVNGLGAGKFQKIDTKGNENIYAYAITHDDGSLSVVVVNQNDPAASAQAPVTLKLPRSAGTGTMMQMTGPTFDAEDQTRIDGLESAGVPEDSRGRIPGFSAGSDSITLPLTSGTASVLKFTF
jgi:hypothetical protein